MPGTNQHSNSKLQTQTQHQSSQSTTTNETTSHHALEPLSSSRTSEAPTSLKVPVRTTHTEEQSSESEKYRPSNIIDDLAGIGAWAGSIPGSLERDIEAVMLDTELRLD
ncbi:uncharacterized protein ASPGLDRAFT_54523 [Aspergillus glaucus CBS 516.65]|uniref:Uncharacterized protein n=1 Tax=Aspergillus glaucus CBS 516.65 TaxID=1160497 RepID=A0A1L9VX44_ASPGL|nr:hypothetical protein ASPGLDRAFT_54523 [Aspergillus glaucus CBS 516.65]OJJ88472.1 hypothetical protein ASPGLDRAFT_54523 [Aspergillus glaucus CBS 516.65]